MKVTYKDYVIEVTPYTWDLHRVRVITEESAAAYKKQYKKEIVSKVGDTTFIHLGYFTSLASVIEMILRFDLSDSDQELNLKEFIELYKNRFNEIKELISQPTYQEAQGLTHQIT